MKNEHIIGMLYPIISVYRIINFKWLHEILKITPYFVVLSKFILFSFWLGFLFEGHCSSSQKYGINMALFNKIQFCCIYRH